MIKFILITILAFATITSKCTDGCLQCKNNKCRICDSTSNYILSAGECQKKELENCEVLNNAGNCLVCSETYHLDFSIKKCIQISDQNLIENCQSYSGPNSCAFCKKEFSLNTGKCEPISSPIQNCDSENSKNLCESCSPGFIRSIDQKSCLDSPDLDNCSTYTNIKCEECSNGYLSNKNSYLQSIFTFLTATSRDLFTMRYNDLSNGVVDMKKFKECQSLTISNCMEYKDFNRCKRCVFGYFVNDLGYCDSYPVDSIPFCKEYDSLVRCKECINNYWINESGFCKEVKDVRNCIAYSKEVENMNCVKCNESYYLGDDGECILRRHDFITNCAVMSDVSETCEQCVLNYRRTSDRKKCLSVITNCQEYVPSNFLTEIFSCRLCKRNFYFNEEEKFCVQGTIPNCDVYQKNKNECEKCVNKFYLENSQCNPHDILLNCERYHPKRKNVCQDCNSSTFLFNKRNDCLKVDINNENCKKFETPSICRECENGYFLTTSGTCSEINPALNCVQMIKNQCSVCLENFVLQNGICYDPVDFFVNECETHNYDGTNNYDKSKCFTCKVNTVPFNYKDSFICVENDFMTEINQVTLDSNCLQYIGTLDGEYSCTRCKFPFYLLDGTCVSTCGNRTLYKQILETYNSDGDRLNESYSVNRINVCGDKIENCKIAAPDINQANPQKTSYVCIECDSGTIPEIEFNDSKVLISDPDVEEFQFGKSPVSFSLPVKCYPVLDINNNNEVLGDINENTNLIDNCQFYLDLGLKKGCTKCQHGYTGVVIDVVHNCEIYKDDQYTCKSCKQGFYLKSDYECKQVEDLDECIEYDTRSDSTKCVKCNETYFVNAGICDKRVQSLSITNCTSDLDADTCQCNSGFFNSATNPAIFCDSLPTNCLEANLNNGVIKCTACDDSVSFLVLPDGICEPGVQQNCLKFADNKCIKCNFQYYILDGNCIGHDPITLCTEYDQDSKNTCDTCGKDSIMFTVEEICKEVEPIEFCEKWSSIEYCEKCGPTKRRTNFDRKCGTIPPSSFCAIQVPMDIDSSGVIDQKDQTENNGVDELVYTCTECNNGYIRIAEEFVFNKPNQNPVHPNHGQTLTKYVCVNHWNYMKEYCDDHNIDGLKNYDFSIKCNYCTETYFEEDFTDKSVCIDKDYIKTKIAGNTIDPNCLRYINDANVYKCDLCRFPYNLKADFTCAETCADTLQSTNYNYLEYDGTNFKWKNEYTGDGECVNIDTVTVDDPCEIKTKIYQETDNTSSTASICVRCKSTSKISVIDFTDKANFASLHTPIDGMHLTEESVIRDPVSAFPAFSTCTSYNNDHATVRNELLGSFSLATQEVPFCDYYILLQVWPDTTITYNRYGCARCKLGYTGIIENITTPDGAYVDQTGQLGYIKECSTMTTCKMASDLNDINKYGAGLIVERKDNGNFLNSLFSCYKCVSDEQIPVVTISFVKDTDEYWKLGGYTSFDPNNGGATLSDITALTNNVLGTQTTCVEFFIAANPGSPATPLVPAVPASPGDPGSPEIPARLEVLPTPITRLTPTTGIVVNTNTAIDFNCALALLNPTKTGDGSKANENTGAFDDSLVCVACKPGYKAVRFQWDADAVEYFGPHWGVVSCEEIVTDNDGNLCSANTEKNTWFNFCENCIHFYDIYKDEISFDKCSPPDALKSIANCFAAYDIGPCVICRKGYFRKENGMCEEIKIPRCESPFYISNFSNLKTSFLSKNHRTMSYLLSGFPIDGCSKCTDSTNEVLTIVKAADTDLPSRFCTNLALVDRPDISKCTNYSWDGAAYVCKACSQSPDVYILTKVGQCTLRTSILSDCLVANEIGGVTCIKCANTHLNVGGVCIILSSLDSNCLTFNVTSTNLPYAVCSKCALGYYLDKNNTVCTIIDTSTYPNCNKFNKTTQSCEGCVTDYMLITHLNSSQCVLVSSTTGVPDFDNNCEELDQIKFNSNKLVCEKCKTITGATPRNFIPTTNNINLKSHCITISTEGTNLQKGYCKTYDLLYENDTDMWNNRSFKCTECTDPNQYYFDELTNLCKLRTETPPQCVAYNPLKNKCTACSDNYVLDISGIACNALPGGLAAEFAVNKGYLQYCKEMHSCASKVIYEGLHPHFSALFSCHECLSTNKIPVVAVRNEDGMFKVVSLQEYGIDNKESYNMRSGSGATSVQCLEMVKESFGIPPSNWEFPSNCGAAVINSERAALNNDVIEDPLNNSFGSISANVYCAACKPTYKANYQTINNEMSDYLISSCDLITTCESSEWFNYCSQCKPGHSYLYHPVKGVQYDVCVPYDNNSDCFAVDNSDSANLKCVFCRKGTYKNPDGICEILNPPRCSLTNFSFRYNYLINDLNSGLYLSRYGIGCHKCDDGFVGLYTHQEDVVSCTLSPYHEVNTNVTNVSKYIFRCMNYKVTEKGELMCDNCADEFVLTIDGTCVPETNILNCQLAFNEDYCTKCLPGNVLINRACVEVEILNCEMYGNDAQSVDQICIRCKKGYYMLDNTCVRGEIKNCELYLEKESCEKCKPGFGLVQNKDENYYCYPMNEGYSCKNLSYSQLQGGILECIECNEKNVISYNNMDYNQTACINFDNVKHCAKYDKNESIALSSYICLECDTNYYLADKNCHARVVNSPKCLSYNLTEDKCLECEEGNFLNADGTNCVPYPEGIPNCLIYLSKEECLTCKTEFYLKDQICYPIKEENKIENCLLYEDEQICSSCAAGYLIIEGECILAIAKDCGEWKTVSSCETCRDNTFGFKLENGILNCVQKAVQNCKESEDYEPYACTICQTDFFPQEGECIAVSNKIISCDIYETDKICSKCIKGAALSQDKLSCVVTPSVIQSLDFNCENSQLIETPQCNTCKPGHYFSHGFCVGCLKNRIEDGCYNCDPVNQDRCLICMPEYYMYDSGKCYKNGEIPPEEVDENNGEGNGDGNGDGNGGGNGGGDGNVDGGDGNGGEDSGAELVMDNLMKMIVFFGLVFWC